MEELKVSEYIRYIASFKNNDINKPIVKIGKILGLDNYYIELDTFKGGVYHIKDFKNLIIGKPKNFIIDLIRVGDYVNDYKVINIIEADICGDEELTDREIQVMTEIGIEHIVEENIKKITTKEEIETIGYEVK